MTFELDKTADINIVRVDAQVHNLPEHFNLMDIYKLKKEGKIINTLELTDAQLVRIYYLLAATVFKDNTNGKI